MFQVNLPTGLMEQNKLCVAQRTCDTVCFGMEIYVCLSQRKKSPSATAPGSPSPHFMLCQLQNGVISDRGELGAKQHENMTFAEPEGGSMDQVYIINPGDLN